MYLVEIYAETMSISCCLSNFSFIPVNMNSYWPILFNGMQFFTLVIYFDISVVPDLALGSPFKLPAVSF